MRIIRRDAARARTVTDWDSRGIVMELVAGFAENDGARVTLGAFEAGGILGRHPTGSWQAFAVVDGEGWVEGDDGRRVGVGTGDVVVWEPGEQHTSGTEHGMRVCIVQTTRDPRPDAHD